MSARPSAAAAIDAGQSVASGLTTRAPLPGWLGLVFVLLVSVGCPARERGREASLDLHGLRGRPMQVAGELLQIDARRNLALEHTAQCADASRAALAEPCGESADEGRGR